MLRVRILRRFLAAQRSVANPRPGRPGRRGGACHRRWIGVLGQRRKHHPRAGLGVDVDWLLFARHHAFRRLVADAIGDLLARAVARARRNDLVRAGIGLDDRRLAAARRPDERPVREGGPRADNRQQQHDHNGHHPAATRLLPVLIEAVIVRRLVIGIVIGAILRKVAAGRLVVLGASVQHVLIAITGDLLTQSRILRQRIVAAVVELGFAMDNGGIKRCRRVSRIEGVFLKIGRLARLPPGGSDFAPRTDGWLAALRPHTAPEQRTARAHMDRAGPDRAERAALAGPAARGRNSRRGQPVRSGAPVRPAGRYHLAAAVPCVSYPGRSHRPPETVCRDNDPPLRCCIPFGKAAHPFFKRSDCCSRGRHPFPAAVKIPQQVEWI